MAEPSKKAQKRAAAVVANTSGIGCSLEQLTQYDCDKESFEKNGIVKCYPIPRVFRVCKDRPAVEVTALLRYKDPSGEPYLPENCLEQLPIGKQWKQIHGRTPEDK
ncbi:hypothetical protein FRC18_011996 [Serendipita sp. 400]|nr:hypothetical protein FRC18_011996 [Serendipita sp. 400]